MVQQFSLAYSPQSNGVIERGNREVKDYIRAMLTSSELLATLHCRQKKQLRLYTYSKIWFADGALKRRHMKGFGEQSQQQYLVPFGINAYKQIHKELYTKSLIIKLRRVTWWATKETPTSYMPL